MRPTTERERERDRETEKGGVEVEAVEGQTMGLPGLVSNQWLCACVSRTRPFLQATNNAPCSFPNANAALLHLGEVKMMIHSVTVLVLYCVVLCCIVLCCLL